jgi:CDP-glycerol glycerophosphotransferase (TagB/SpsB family)
MNKTVNIYYFANQVYQFSNALPLYRKIGGRLIIHTIKKFLQVKMYLRGLNQSPDHKTFLNTPQVLWREITDLNDLEGIILSLSATAIDCNHQKCKTIFIGHGTGDKKYGSGGDVFKNYDYHFISGPKHLQKLKDLNIDIPDDRLIKIGNLRFDDYLNHKLERQKELDRLGIIDRKRKNVLYAPTWRWGGGTLKRFVYYFANEITKKFNLIIRPHHHERRYLPGLRWWAKTNGIKNIYFSNPSWLKKSDTMNDFIASDILISDTSSILYEYLITSQPIIVIKNNFTDLHRMPDQMNIMKHVTIFDGTGDITKLIERNLEDKESKKKYAEILNHCFYFNDGKSVERSLTFLNSFQ